MVWGFIIGLLLTAGVCVLVSSLSGKNMSVLSWIVALALFIGLSIETNRLINAIQGRSDVADLVSTISGSIPESFQYSDNSSVISFEEANQIALGCKMVMPTMSSDFRAQDFQGQSYSNISSIISDQINRGMSHRVWNMIGWIALTLVVGSILIAVTAGMNGGSSHGRRPSGSSTYHSHDDF